MSAKMKFASSSKNFGFEKNNGYPKEVAQFAVVNKPYNRLFAVSLSETQSSLDTAFWSAEVKSSLLTLLYAIRTLHACN